MATPVIADEAQRTRAALAANNAAAPERFRQLAANYALPDLASALDEILAGLRDGNRPQVAINLKFALEAYLDLYRPPAGRRHPGANL